MASILDRLGSGTEWKERFELERTRRKEAERLLEEKATELYNASQKLQDQLEEIRSLVEELTQTKDVLDKHNKDMNDSVVYASRIQKALLPSAQQLSAHFNSFHIFSPKDILSGDFYWVHANERQAFLACADCTGHGIPGSIMSILGLQLLRYLLDVNNDWSPASLMKMMDRELSSLLAQNAETGTQLQDGMDASFILFDATEPRVELSMANHKALLFKDGELQRVQGDKMSLGGDYMSQFSYTTHRWQAEPGTRIYLFSDGILDQFGGENNRKLGFSRFVELIQESVFHPLLEQKELLERQFREWMGTKPQTDDVLVIGLEF